MAGEKYRTRDGNWDMDQVRLDRNRTPGRIRTLEPEVARTDRHVSISRKAAVVAGVGTVVEAIAHAPAEAIVATGITAVASLGYAAIKHVLGMDNAKDLADARYLHQVFPPGSWPSGGGVGGAR